MRAPLQAITAALVLVALGCDRVEQDGPDGGQPVTDGGDTLPAPVIQAISLSDAEEGKRYCQTLSATGGTPPVVWSLESVPEALQWLEMNPSTGEMCGTPTGVVLPGQKFTARVTDGEERSDARELTLAVVGCHEGSVASCALPSGEACMMGEKTCKNGSYGECGKWALSQDTASCGESCGACGQGANLCTDGLCKCGEGEACDATAATCCGTGVEGSCVDTQADLENCGGCGQSCLDTNGDGQSDVPAGTTPACTAGACSYECKDGYARCPADAAACIHVAEDPQNCGTCGKVCPTSSNPPPNTVVPSDVCNQGLCQAYCVPGYASCNSDMLVDGCEVHTSQDLNNCGGCGVVCGGKPNVIASGYACASGTCKVATGGCAAGWADKNGDYADGCEVDLMTDESNCGAINTVCGAPARGTGECVSGKCTITSCSAGYSDCDAAYANGCEANLDSDDTCGSCSKSCGGASACNGSGDCCYQECDPERKPPCITICE